MNIEILDIDNKITMPANVWEECMRIGEKELGIVFNEDTKKAPILDKAIPIILEKDNMSINAVTNHEYGISPKNEIEI